MDFDFRTFSTRSFERFAQAMALHVLGKGVLVFGDGPDGAREATYEGILAYPSVAENWSGYTVMQAKFLQVSRTPQEDADWLVGQLTAEFEKFSEPQSTLIKPDYYILVSNARLSPMPEGIRGKGGIEKIDQVFKKYKKKIGFKDYRVWHLDQLSTMLMGANELRRSYAAWLSSSDVIADMLDNINAKTKAVRQAMYRYLTRELRAHQPVRLQQAGHSADVQIMIEDVFIDLPYRLHDQPDFQHLKTKLLLSTLLDRSRDCLDGASVTAQQCNDIGRPERILLLGGPGQGKSTLSQFLAQIFRANILNSDNERNNTADIKLIIENTLSKAVSADLGIDVPRRFPLRVDLPNYADWLSNNNKNAADSLLHYLAKLISEVSHADLTIEDLRSWITSFPTIFILDGLDEVPPSANRSSVLRAINEFWDEATTADVLMIVTTRPQGYNDDLGANYYSKFEMTSLEPTQAIAYGEKLAAARISDHVQCERVITRLKEAAKSNTTTRLMISPLQVAILLALIDQRGDAPTDRWSLFYKYFDVVLQREQGKVGPVGQTMRLWGRHISAIHYKAGFLLHVESESKGKSEAYFSAAELKTLIQGQLKEDDFEGDELRSITHELLAASTERLVLIVQREDDRFSFEVRSLQEFMAAAHLMNGHQAVVQDRLRYISNREHWLHVFQIAASKCFSVNDSEHYRDTIVTICRDLNENGEEIDRLLRTGSRLALALLNDGLAYDQPRYRRLLINESFNLLLAGPSLLPDSLSDHCSREPSKTTESLRRYLSSAYTESINAVWKFLLHCSAKGQGWSNNLLNEIWPEDPTEAFNILVQWIEPSADSSIVNRMRRTITDCSPVSISSALRDSDNISTHRIVRIFPCLALLTYIQTEKLNIEVKINNLDTPLKICLTPLTISQDQRKVFDNIPGTDSWASVRALRDFHISPSATALAGLLDRILDEGWLEDFNAMLSNLPWPLASVFLLLGKTEDERLVINQVRNGAYGDIEDWNAAELRWRSEGITDFDFNFLTHGRFYGADVSRVGFPIISYSISHTDTGNDWLSKLLIYGLESKGDVRKRMQNILRFVLRVHAPKIPISYEEVLFLLEEENEPKSQSWISPEILEHLPLEYVVDKDILTRLDHLGRIGKVSLPNSVKISPSIYHELIENLKEFPGLIVFLSKLLATEKSTSYANYLNNIELNEFSSTENLLFSNYATILDLINGIVDENSLESILKKTDVYQNEQVSTLLFKFLDNEFMAKERERIVVEALALVYNRNPALQDRMLMSKIQSYANSRQAELREPSYWRKLDLGENLLDLTLKRQTLMNLTKS